MYSVDETYQNHILNSLVRRPKSKIVVDGMEYTGESHLKTFPKIEHSTEDIFGAFPAKICEFEVYNLDGSVNLNGKEVSVYRGLVVGGMPQWVPMGIFKAESKDITTNLTTKTIKFKGSDRSRLFDVAFNSTLHTYPCTVLDFVKQLCTNHSVTLANEDFPFASLELTAAPEFAEGVTERELIRKIAQLGGCIVQITRNGELKISQPETASIPITSGKYSSLSKERPVYITTVTISQSDAEDVTVSDNTYVGVYGEYVYKIADNPFIKNRQNEVIDEVKNNILNRNVTPFILNGFIDDFIYDLNDMVTVRDKSGTEFTTPILSLKTQNRIRSDFKTEVQKEGTSSGSLGGSLKQQVENSIKDNNDFKKAQTGLNELIANAMGLHTTVVDDGAGGKLYYFHNEPTLETSTYIVTITSNGFAFTTGSGCWNGGDPQWKYGVDAEGNAVLNTLALHGLTADWIKAGTLQSLNGSTFFNLDEGEIGSEQTEEAVYIFGHNASVDDCFEKTLKKTSKLSVEGGSIIQSVNIETVPAEGEESEIIDAYALSIGMFGDTQKGITYTYSNTYYERTGRFYFKKPDDWDSKNDFGKSLVLLTNFLLAQAFPNGFTLKNTDTNEQTTISAKGVKVQVRDTETGKYRVSETNNEGVLVYCTDANGDVTGHGGFVYDIENEKAISYADEFEYPSGATAGTVFTQSLGIVSPTDNEPVINLANLMSEGKSLIHFRLTLSSYYGCSEYIIYFHKTNEQIWVNTKYVTASSNCGAKVYGTPVIKGFTVTGEHNLVEGTEITVSTKGNGNSYNGYTTMTVEILHEGG